MDVQWLRARLRRNTKTLIFYCEREHKKKSRPDYATQRGLPAKFLIKFRERRIREKFARRFDYGRRVAKWCYIIIGNNSRYFNLTETLREINAARAEWNLRASRDICPVSYASALVIRCSREILSLHPLPLKYLWGIEEECSNVLIIFGAEFVSFVGIQRD